MKFHRPLEKAIFLQRKCDSIIEAEVNAMKINIFCPNHSLLKNCAILGSSIWYSPPIYTPYYTTATWQLAEIDYGNLILVNNQLCSKLFLEGLKIGNIKLEKLNYDNLVIRPDDRLFANYKYDFNLKGAKNKSKNN